jgi:hypothetical protein
MSETFTTTCVIPVTDKVREFFTAINFHPIPEDAAFICFLDDGESTFLTAEELDAPRLAGFLDPDHKSIMMFYSTTPIKIEF